MPTKNADAFAPALSYAVLALFDFRNTVVFDDIVHILVTTTGKGNEYRAFAHALCKLDTVCHSMRTFNSWDNPFHSGEFKECIDGFFVIDKKTKETLGFAKTKEEATEIIKELSRN